MLLPQPAVGERFVLRNAVVIRASIQAAPPEHSLLCSADGVFIGFGAVGEIDGLWPLVELGIWVGRTFSLGASECSVCLEMQILDV